MTDIHEELHTCFVELFLLLMASKDFTCLLALTILLIKEISNRQKNQQINEFCPDRCIPSRMNLNDESPLFRFLIETLGTYYNVVSTHLHTIENNLALSWWHLLPFPIVHLIIICNQLPTDTHGSEFKRKSTVIMAKVSTFHRIYPVFKNRVMPRFLTHIHQAVVHIEAREA